MYITLLLLLLLLLLSFGPLFIYYTFILTFTFKGRYCLFNTVTSRELNMLFIVEFFSIAFTDYAGNIGHATVI